MRALTLGSPGGQPGSRMRPYRAMLCVVLSGVAASACSLDRAGRAAPRDGGVAVLDGGRRDAIVGIDASDDGGPRDVGPPRDGPCDVGTVDLDGDPRNGCECVVARELCNGVDDDCDPTTFDGADDPERGTPCDGGDADSCADGVRVCNGGRLDCTDDAATHAETCDRTDEDCDGRVDEGLGIEVCNGVDDDCDTLVDEAGAMDVRTFYPDDDDDGYGDSLRPTRACEAPDGYVERGGDCDDRRPDRAPGLVERCNGRDDDCSGLIDDAGACPGCVRAEHGGVVYQLCSGLQRWATAASLCATSGYRLAWVETAAESTTLAASALPRIGRFWIGVSQDGSSWRLIGGPLVSSPPWGPMQPDDGDWMTTEDCVEVGRYGDGRWNDADCDGELGYVCELPP